MARTEPEPSTNGGKTACATGEPKRAACPGTDSPPDAAEGYRQQRKWRIRMLVFHLVLVAAPAVFLIPGVSGFLEPYRWCLWKRLLGFECPACGITRSAMAFLTGDLSASFGYHPAGPFIIVVLWLTAIYFVIIILLQRRIVIDWQREVKVYARFELIAVVALIAGWVLRGVLD